MENINKKLGFGLLAVSGISALLSVINFVSMEYYLGFISLALALIFQILLACTIMRDKNDKFTMISVILVALFTFNLGGIVAIIMRLILRKNNSEKIRKAWFVPAIIAGAMLLLTISLSFIGILNLLLTVAYYLIFGYWFIRYLKVNG